MMMARVIVWLWWGALCATQLVSASEPVAPPLRLVVVLGDSLATGYGLDPAESYPALLQKKIQEADWPFAVRNAGVSGDTTAGGLRRLDWVLQGPVEVLVVALGGNDGLRGIDPAATKANLRAIITRTRARNPDTQIVLAGMRMPPNMGREYTEEFAAIFPDLAREERVALVPFLLEGVGGKPEMNQPDLIHPTAAGQRIIAENVWVVLRPILEKLAAGQ